MIQSGNNGYVDTRLDVLVNVMRERLDDPEVARIWGERGCPLARERFGIGRFIQRV